ncbi:MAG: hypothetical protein R2774_13930 [Saprospiraceae bacterium]
MYKRIGIVAIIVAVILSIPFIAMQFTEEVSWNVSDFIVMASILFSVGLGLNFIIKSHFRSSIKIWFLVSMIAVFFLIWVELAVGLFGTPFAGS